MQKNLIITTSLWRSLYWNKYCWVVANWFYYNLVLHWTQHWITISLIVYGFVARFCFLSISIVLPDCLLYNLAMSIDFSCCLIYSLSFFFSGSIYCPLWLAGTLSVQCSFLLCSLVLYFLLWILIVLSRILKSLVL